MGMRILFGSPPSPPPVLSAEVLLGLHAPDGSRPCRVGLGRALRWLGDREIQLELALEEAKSVLTSDDLEWGLSALGISGGDYGDGYDFSDGAGDGCGEGYGDGYGYGSGYGYGDRYGSGSGSGSGYGYGYGYDSGSGSGDGDGNGYGSGSCDGDGNGEEVE